MIASLKMIPVRWHFYQLSGVSLGLLKISIIHYSKGLRFDSLFSQALLMFCRAATYINVRCVLPSHI